METKRINPKDAKITLLTEEQAKKLPPEMLKKDCWWWLRSPDRFHYATVVDGGSFTYNSDDFIDRGFGVVPAFEVDNLKTRLGDKVYVGKLRCTVVDFNLVLSDEVVCKHRFDKKSSNWETSELKAFIESKEFAEKYILDNTTYKLCREYKYDSDGDQIGEVKFTVSEGFLRAYLDCRELEYESVSEFLACYTSGEGNLVYQAAKENNALVDNLGIVYYGGYAADEAKITLLTMEQTYKLPIETLRKGNWWWLQGPSDLAFFAIAVSYDGAKCDYRDIRGDCNGVVPAFEVNNLNLNMGEKTYVGKLCCTVVGDNLVLSDEIVCEHCFDRKSNSWETSELKAFIESKEFLDKYVKF